MFSKLFIGLTAVVVAVNAQGTTSSSASAASPSLDACVLGCISAAALQDGCVSFSNLTCVCTNPQFQADAGGCIASQCSPTDLQAALNLQSAECAGTTLTGPSATPSPVPFTFTSGASASVTTSSGSGSASGTSVTGGAGVSGGTSATGASSATGGASTSIPTASATNGASTASSLASPTTSAASSSTTSSGAGSLTAKGGVAALMAMIAGFLAL